MKLLLLAVVVTVCCSAAISNLKVSGTTSTQAIVSYTAPNASGCSLAISETADTSGNPQPPLVHDVDPTLFSGADQDGRAGSITHGTARTFVIGRRDAERAADGRYYSRALQTNTMHYGKITCGGDQALFTFQTTNIPLGIGYSDPWPTDPAVPGDWPAPSSPGSIMNEEMIEPQTGVRIQHLTYPGIGYSARADVAFGTAYNQGQDPCDTAGPWSHPCNVMDGRPASVGDSTGWLVLRPNNLAFGWGNTNSSYGYSLNQFQVTLKGRSDSADPNLRLLDVCLSMNGGASCASKVQTVKLARRTSLITLGTHQPGAMGIDPWLFDSMPRLNRYESSTHSGTVTIDGTALKQTAGDLFSSYWTEGGQGRLRLSNVSAADACAAPPAPNHSVEVILTGGFGNLLNLAASPNLAIQAATYYCAPDFAVMVRRHSSDSNSSVAIDAAKFSYVSGQAGEWIAQGYSDVCSSTAINGGFLCILPLGGGWTALAWINPADGTANMVGPAVANAKSTGSEQWASTGCPLFAPDAFETIDDTKSVPTWYCVASSGGKSVILQITYSGTYSTNRIFADGEGIGMADPTHTDNYSISFKNATITDLTPASAGKDLVSLINNFTGQTMDPGMICHNGPVQQGKMLVYCYRNQNTLSWLAVFDPGDGNPTHAGQTGGPNIVAAMSSWGGGAARWSVNHSTQDYGHSGYFGYNASTITAGSAAPGNTAVIVTTSDPIPATGTDCSQWSNPMGVTGTNCTQVQISANQQSYEPYYWTAVPPQGQNPGELSTAQVGDIWCLSASQTSCNWLSGNNEVLVLIQKGANGQWVFQRNAAHWPGGPRAIAGTGPKYLFAMSGATSLSFPDPAYPSFYGTSWGGNVYWDYANDPHGQNPVKDPAYFDAHGASRPWIAVESSSYPTPPYSPNYRVRHAKGFPELFQAPVSYVAANASFAGAYAAAIPNVWQSHASVSGNLASDTESQAAFDIRPLVGKYSSPPAPPELWTLVSGQLWKTTYRATDADNIGNLNRKVLPTAASSGPHPLLDVSGPSSSISDAADNSYQYCIPRKTGECRPGSAVGEIYVNSPSIVYPYCYGMGASGQTSPANDICIDNMPAVGQALLQFSTLQPDPSGQFQRILVKTMTGRLKLTSGFANTRPLPDNSWLIFQGNYVGSERRELYMAKLPSFPASDGVNRSTFVPLSLQLSAPAGLGVTNAIVEFGYSEFGGNCTTRNEACIATAGTIGAVPFQFASENPDGASCATTCVVAIPGVSQRILYYKVKYRDASNHVVAATPVQVMATP